MNQKNEALIAEDHLPTLERLQKCLLKELDIQVSSASDRTEALRVIAEKRSELFLVITDIRMPSATDGNTIAQRAIEEGIPVIIITALPESIYEEVREKCVTVFKKPIDLMTLLDTVEPLIKK